MPDGKIYPLEHRSHAPPSQTGQPVPIGHGDNRGGNAYVVERFGQGDEFILAGEKTGNYDGRANVG